MPHLSLSLLGPFQAMLDGQPLTDFESNKVRALLAYLAVEAVIAQRLQRLSGELRDFLRVASVEGEDFTAEVVGMVLHIDEQQVLQMLSGELVQLTNCLK